ncbi:MAG: S-methyl-5-thioribose-1-phosphate isomerase [Nanoarchaeota archaeon]
MIVNNKEYRTIWMERNIVKIINQRLLPYSFKIIELKSYLEIADAIKNMLIRGAPAIGAAGAYGLTQAVLEYNGDFSAFLEYINDAYLTLLSTRPTAYDLKFALDKIKDCVTECNNIQEAKDIAVRESNNYADTSVEMCKAIGIYGEKLIKHNARILTHCNAGALACVDYGTALAPIRLAHKNNKNVFVYVDETRPALQGAKLTAWELSNERIPHVIIADNSAGLFMYKGEIDIVITGADRIAKNGDTANKIGTYEKAVLAKENNVPFYISAPSSTIDLSTPNGKEIPIEERTQDEMLYCYGLSENGKIKKIRIANNSNVKNPVFDVTPAKYITGVITEKGVFKPDEIERAYSENIKKEIRLPIQDEKYNEPDSSDF